MTVVYCTGNCLIDSDQRSILQTTTCITVTHTFDMYQRNDKQRQLSGGLVFANNSVCLRARVCVCFVVIVTTNFIACHNRHTNLLFQIIRFENKARLFSYHVECVFVCNSICF